jgi:hypothetical protein
MDSLLSMGFDEGTAREALNAAGGNVENALDMLLSGGLPDQVRPWCHQLSLNPYTYFIH